MKFLFSFIAMILVISGCAQSQSTTIEVDYSQFPNMPIVDIIVNGQGPFPFLVDTGSTFSHIAFDVLGKTGLASDNLTSIHVLHPDKLYEKPLTETAALSFPNTDIKRTTKFVVSDRKLLGNSIAGVIGIDTLINSTIQNVPSEKKLKLTLPNNAYECDVKIKTSQCHQLNPKVPRIEAVLGGEKMNLLLDTGNQGERSFLFKKGKLNNLLWEQYGHYSASGIIKSISDKPVKTLKTRNFIFGEQNNCYADFIIRDPADSSFVYPENLALLGWNAIVGAAFSINFKSGETRYPPETCPYTKMNRLGVWRFMITDDREQAMIKFVEIGSPADRAGLKDGD